jgi:transcriptional regulator with XRE-family HTH domain
MKLGDLRRARSLSQQEMAERLSTNQGGVSRLENQTDMYIRSVRKYVEAAGGRLVLSAIFPDAPPIEIEALGEIGDDELARDHA